MNYKIREALESDAEGITFVHVSSWKTSYAGIIDQTFLDNISYVDRLNRWREILKDKESLHLVAVIDDQIIGFADAGTVRPEPGISKDSGEIYAIYILEDHKRKGIGKALFKECRRWFGNQNIGHFIVWALEENLQAKAFYEDEGGENITQKTISMGDKGYRESCYLFTLENSDY